MLDEILPLRRRFTRQETLDGRIDEIYAGVRAFGFDGLIYDYTPVPFDLDGSIMIPSLLKLRNMADDMHDYWCARGYFRIDPVQILATRTTTPFFWSYDAAAETRIRGFLTEETAPVARYLREREVSSGVTVPIHMPRGDYATVTAVRFGGRAKEENDTLRHIADFSLLAHVFHEAAFALFDDGVRSAGAARLTERERECLRYSAQGLSAKEISRIIDRAVPTVVLHLNSAARKLNARNRTQAVVRAAHYRLLEH
ncbi:MAG: LuxR family transcriptional regulator [Mesorhizobium sp.]|uniref:LuxR family transcriptional regulator n=1 Tax=unclassified Mesorhizobium TaxID=325217 RepID=UPI000FE729D3|nr:MULTISPECIES: LuxR family transcriptional regulator [unclassified Mesorhizobium]RWB31438.1 MAG: LuxR family transcriptional regulator [Mesorhizobium sp.]RWB81091.1 MAG: LuxR family transcriptional regulator [Mesorhizobium sp.]RWC23799.1 MAG: LuxR family transcriptional regulator [Mesorhizobium sp.]RWD18615.1 MAG: LuxR family transcriptional regulator [Mesorhizobium sp.]TGU01480.1 LuxR family transcriptional regulator [Mesorhizobium sp. M5C.F.Ca.ET.164.01.1.1]